MLTSACRDIIISIVRVISILNVDFLDFVWSGVPAIEWAIAEPGIAVLIASAPILRPVFDKMIPSSLIHSIHTKNPLHKSLPNREYASYGQLPEDHFELVHGGGDGFGPSVSASQTALRALDSTPIADSSKDGLVAPGNAQIRKEITIEIG